MYNKLGGYFFVFIAFLFIYDLNLLIVLLFTYLFIKNVSSSTTHFIFVQGDIKTNGHQTISIIKGEKLKHKQVIEQVLTINFI